MFCARNNNIKENLRRILPALVMMFFLVPGMMFYQGCANKNRLENLDPWSRDGDLISSGKYRSVIIEDMDNDGNIDVVGGSSSPGTVAVWYGDGTGKLSAPSLLPIKCDVRAVAAGDFNEDGIMDLTLTVQREASGIMVWEGSPTRKWVKGKSPVKTKKYEGIETADINKDGHIDIVAANATRDTQGGIQVWLGDGKGKWSRDTGPTVSGIFMDIAVADFDGDGSLDIAGSGWGTYGTVRIWYGDGAGGWSSSAPLIKGSFYSLSAADINVDGHLDLLAGSYRQGIKIFFGDAENEFKKMSFPEKTGNFWQALSVDINGDGIRDILAGSNEAYGIKAWKYNGKKSWKPIKGKFPNTGTYYGLTTADIDNDGLEDVCAASFGGGVKIWMGKEIKKDKPVYDINEDGLSDAAINSEPSLKRIDENETYRTINGVPEYKIGLEDVLEITIWKGTIGTKELVPVMASGKISVDLIADLDVNGLTPSQLDALITDELRKYVNKPRVDIVVKNYKSKFITMMGALNGPIRFGKSKYKLTGKATVLDMVSAAGGSTANANLSRVRLRRKNGQTFNLDLYRAVTHGDTAQNMIVDHGDLVFVPTITKDDNRVYVFGEVRNPGVYNFSGSDMRVFDAVSQAGGVTIYAHEQSTKVVRGDIARPEVVSADLKRLIEDGDQTQNLFLANGDLVYVPRSYLGDVNLFVKRLRPLLELIFIPGRIARDIDEIEDLNDD